MCFIDLTKAYDSVDQTLFWAALARFDVPHNMVSVIGQFYYGMRACVRLDDRGCSGWFAVVINVAYTRFKADKNNMDALVHLRKKKGAGGAGGNNCRRASPGDAALGHALR